MRPKQRVRKMYTQPDSCDKLYPADENQAKMDKVNIKDLQLNIKEVGRNVSDSKNNRNFMYKNAHFYMPNKFNKLNRKQLIKKLPDINLTPLSNLSKPLKLNPLEEKQAENPKFNKKNQTYLLNSLFQILKPQEPTSTLQPDKYRERSYKSNHKKMAVDSFYDNEFFNINSNSSAKNNRGPRILQNDITRLSSHNNNVMRRRIVSEEKSRPKYHEDSLQKLKETTFEQFKRCAIEKPESSAKFKQSFEQPKQNFENLEIITFYNKFPSVKKEDQSLYDQAEESSFMSRGNNQGSKRQSNGKNKPKSPLKNLIKPMYRNQPQQENQFIFQAK